MNKILKIVLCCLGAMLPLTSSAQTTSDASTAAASTSKPDRHWFNIKVLARAYGDSVVVRWAPDEYIPWKYLNAYGYQVVRLDRQTYDADTLAANVHPIRRAEFQRRFAENDSLAGAAVQLIFGRGTRMNETQAEPGTPGSIIELSEEQATLFGFGMLIAELRPDLAEAMGLMYVDRTARRGAKYDYIVRPLVPDSVLPVYQGAAFGIINEPSQPDNYITEITDSIRPPRAIELFWPYDKHTVFDIERRDNERGEWRTLNQRPYLPTQMDEDLTGMNRYLDEDLDTGIYEYRIRAYDTFGQRTNPSAVHRVELKDLVPPSIPVLTLIEIERPDSAVLARLHWRKDTLEQDLAGYVPLYYNERMTLGTWLPLTSSLLAPTDTVCMVNVTGLSTGHIVIAAYDSNGNIAHSVPMLIRISDVKPPQTPTGLKALVSPTGRVTLRWQPSPDNDIMEYSIWKANAPDHVFGRISPTDMRDTLFVDSISVRANQKYIYYKVMATDFSGNSSELSEAVAVPIPDLTRPQFCRADSIYMDEDCIRIWWVGSPEASVKTHRVLRRLKGQEQWTLLAIVDADSLGPDHRFLMEDRPPYVQDRRYYYAVESLSRMGISSGLSLQQSFLFRGPQVIDIDLKLHGAFNSSTGDTRLTWDTGGVPTDADYYYVVYRKGPADKDFRFMTSANPSEPLYSDGLLRPGQQADYYVKIRFRDGRVSTPSNTVTVSAPANK